MAILFLSGFDWPNSPTDEMDNLQRETSFTGTYTEIGRYDGRALSVYWFTQSGPKFPNASTVISNFALCKPEQAGSTIATLYNGNHSQAYISMDATGIISLYNASGLIISGTKKILRSNWYWINWKVTIGPNATSQLWIDGVLDHDVLSANTGVGYLSSTSVQFVGGNHPAGVNGNVLIDDLFILDDSGPAPWNDILPDTHIFTAFPNGNISVTWTPNTAAWNYAEIDESPDDGDTTYVGTNLPQNTDIYSVFPNPNRSPVQIVQINWVARKDSTGNRYIQIQTDGVLGDVFELTSVYKGYRKLYYVEPSSSMPWSPSLADAIQPGITLVS
jgi:hypothetical protein